MKVLRVNFPEEFRTEVLSKLEALGLSIRVIERTPGTDDVIIHLANEVPDNLEPILREAVYTEIRATKASRLKQYEDILTKLTPDKIENYINAQVTDLASAKALFIKILKLLAYFVKKETE